MKSIELVDKPCVFYFENEEIKILNWKNEESALFYSNNKLFFGISGGLHIMNDRMKNDVCMFTNNCWEWPDDLGNLKTKKDDYFDFEHLFLVSGKNKNFAAE
jgi:hypothetical protein